MDCESRLPSPLFASPEVFDCVFEKFGSNLLVRDSGRPVQKDQLISRES